MKRKRDEKPWLSIWIKPEKTIRKLIGKNSNQHIRFIAVLFSALNIEQTFTIFHSFGWLSELSWKTTLLIIGVGILASFIVINVGSFVLLHIGRWFSGSAKLEHVRCAILWSSIPAIVAILFWLPTDILMLSKYVDVNSLLLLPVTLLAAISQPIGNILFLVSLGLLVRTLAAVHNYSKWRAVFTLLIVMMFVVVPIALYKLIGIMNEAEAYGLIFVELFLV